MYRNQNPLFLGIGLIAGTLVITTWVVLALGPRVVGIGTERVMEDMQQQAQRARQEHEIVRGEQDYQRELRQKGLGKDRTVRNSAPKTSYRPSRATYTPSAPSGSKEPVRVAGVYYPEEAAAPVASDWTTAGVSVVAGGGMLACLAGFGAFFVLWPRKEPAAVEPAMDDQDV